MKFQLQLFSTFEWNEQQFKLRGKSNQHCLSRNWYHLMLHIFMILYFFSWAGKLELKSYSYTYCILTRNRLNVKHVERSASETAHRDQEQHWEGWQGGGGDRAWTLRRWCSTRTSLPPLTLYTVHPCSRSVTKVNIWSCRKSVSTVEGNIQSITQIAHLQKAFWPETLLWPVWLYLDI